MGTVRPSGYERCLPQFTNFLHIRPPIPSLAQLAPTRLEASETKEASLLGPRREVGREKTNLLLWRNGQEFGPPQGERYRASLPPSRLFSGNTAPRYRCRGCLESSQDVSCCCPLSPIEKETPSPKPGREPGAPPRGCAESGIPTRPSRTTVCASTATPSSARCWPIA